jgi:hypothetical protein
MGLETMLVHTWDSRMRFTRDDNLDDPFQGWKQGRIDRHKQRKGLHIAIIVGLFAWTAWALRRTKALWIGQALAAPLVMAMTNLTCYYYSMFILCAALTVGHIFSGRIWLSHCGFTAPGLRRLQPGAALGLLAAVQPGAPEGLVGRQARAQEPGQG